MAGLSQRVVASICSKFAALVLLAILLPPLSFSQQVPAQEASETRKSSEPPSSSIVIPDGTPVQLRFAQAIWGFPISPFILDPPHPPFKKGDAVRIVAAADVEVAGHIVIRRGSLGQATVTNTNHIIDRKHPNTGVDLRLDWVSSINEQIVPLRLHKKGKQGSIILDVYSDHGGFSVNQESLAHGLFEAMTYQTLAKSLHQKLWVPVGTRMVGFVHGSFSLDAVRLAEAEGRLPVPNTTGLITIYRIKGQKEQRLEVFCDGKSFAQLGSRQFFELELPPGDHVFTISGGESFLLTVSQGKEYYLWLRWHSISGAWKIVSVITPEGEDGISDGEMVGAHSLTD